MPDVSGLATKASVEAIRELIPDTATPENQLADKDFVNSSIATNTSYFLGTFNTLEELESQTATNNDYAFWKTTDSDGNTVYKRYKYNGSEWVFEYDLNNSSFTAKQWATINSGLTAESLESKQDTLESGVNIKTINGESVLGGGNIEIPGRDLIDDSITDSAHTWSSEKIENITLKKGGIGVPQVTYFSASPSSGSYELVRFYYRSAFRCVISGTCANYAEAKIIDVISSSASSPQSNTLGSNSIGSQGSFSFGGGDWAQSSMYWNKPTTEEHVYYTVVFIPYSEYVSLVI